MIGERERGGRGANDHVCVSVCGRVVVCRVRVCSEGGACAWGSTGVRAATVQSRMGRAVDVCSEGVRKAGAEWGGVSAVGLGEVTGVHAVRCKQLDGERWI